MIKKEQDYTKAYEHGDYPGSAASGERGTALLSPRRPRILMYHAVTSVERDPNRICISPQRFNAQMLYLKRHNLRGVSIREMRRAAAAGDIRNLVGLTFDDGYENFLHTAVPILEKFGFSATVFVVAGRLARDNDWEHSFEPRPPMKLLGAEGVREVSRRGMEVGSHSMVHPKLSEVPPGRLQEEISGSRRVLSELLDEAVGGFCYPYGNVNGAVIEAVRRAGYAYACAWKVRPEGSDYELPRIPVDEVDNLLRFKAKLRIYPQYVRVTRLLKR